LGSGRSGLGTRYRPRAGLPSSEGLPRPGDDQNRRRWPPSAPSRLGGRSTGAPAAAACDLNYANRLDPENPAITAALGAALAQNGRLDEAAEAYRLAAAWDPQNPGFWLFLAEFSLRYDYQVESIGLDGARNAVALSPQDPAALSALGMAHSLVGEGPTGERLLQSPVSLDPSSALGWYRSALVLLDQGRADEAQQALTTAVTLDSGGVIGRLAQASLANLAAGLR